MPKLAKSLVLLYSGGTSNEDPLLSLGGLASTAPGRRVDSQGFTASTIPGVEVVFATRNPLGLGTLSYDHTLSRVGWTPFGGVAYTVAVQQSGLVSVGSATLGYVQVDITVGSLPGSDDSCSIDITPLLGTVFGVHPYSARASGITEYRCVYLKNEGVEPLYGFTMAVSHAGSYSTLSLGSTIVPYSVLSSGLSATQGFGSFSPFVGSAPFIFDAGPPLPKIESVLLFADGTPIYVPYIPATPTYSDGATYSLPDTIADRYDSGGVLAGINWLPALRWPTIPAGCMIWFWVKKVTIPFGASTDTEEMYLDADMTT